MGERICVGVGVTVSIGLGIAVGVWVGIGVTVGIGVFVGLGGEVGNFVGTEVAFGITIGVQVQDGLRVPSQQTVRPLGEQPQTPLCQEQQPLFARTGELVKSSIRMLKMNTKVPFNTAIHPPGIESANLCNQSGYKPYHISLHHTQV